MKKFKSNTSVKSTSTQGGGGGGGGRCVSEESRIPRRNWGLSSKADENN